MNCNDFHQPTDPLPTEGKVICILGPNKLQNSLIASALEPTVGAKCFVIESLDGSAKYEEDGVGTTRLVLWDRFGKNAKECFSEYEANAHQMLGHPEHEEFRWVDAAAASQLLNRRMQGVLAWVMMQMEA